MNDVTLTKTNVFDIISFVMKIQITNIKWEPQDEMLSEEEVEALLEEAPSELEVEVDSEDEFESDPESFLDTDELRVRKFKWNVVAKA